MKNKWRNIVVLTLIVLLATACNQESEIELPPAESDFSVTSADGTTIGFIKVGSGPVDIVFVHGVLSTAEDWLPVANKLLEQCTCYVMDRRGRGRSGDGEDYNFQREIEDIDAVLSILGPDTYLLGHSSGAIYTLEAALRNPIAGLILYEPPLHFRGFENLLNDIRSLVEKDRLDDATALFLTEEAGASESDMSDLRAAPYWPGITELSPTLVREWDAILEFNPTVERYQFLSMPTLLLSGTESLSNPSFATDDLERLLPDVRKMMLDGQGHEGNVMVPSVVAEKLETFLQEVMP